MGDTFVSRRPVVEWYRTRPQNFGSVFRIPVVRILVGERRHRCRIGRTGVRTADPKLYSLLHYHSTAANTDVHCSPHCLDLCLPLAKNPQCAIGAEGVCRLVVLGVGTLMGGGCPGHWVWGRRGRVQKL